MIHIWIRRTLDWHDEAQVAARLIPAFRPTLEMWNATFTMPYHRFRHRLKTIARMSLDRVEGAVCCELSNVPPGGLIVPTDDDDWFAPDLASRLRDAAAHHADRGGFLWRRDVIEPPPRLRTGLGWLLARVVPPRDPHTCKTNNYAVRNLPEWRDLLTSHVGASAYFDAHPGAIGRIDAMLAIQNRTPASRTALRVRRRPSIGRDELLAVLERYRGLYARWRPRPEARWAAPYVSLMAELMEELRPR